MPIYGKDHFLLNLTVKRGQLHQLVHRTQTPMVTPSIPTMVAMATPFTTVIWVQGWYQNLPPFHPHHPLKISKLGTISWNRKLLGWNNFISDMFNSFHLISVFSRSEKDAYQMERVIIEVVVNPLETGNTHVCH